MRHFTIPVFVPELGCPNQCVFCNQRKISGALCQPSEQEVVSTIEKYLSTIPSGNEVEIGFFGGNFTGIEPEMMESYLEVAQRYIKRGMAEGIRISTRPDYIYPRILEILKKYGVQTIELGAQSLDEEVLKLSGRGHTVADVADASQLILEAGFSLGLQMMVGLPGDTPEKSLATARVIADLGASSTRIYPTLVIRDTELEALYRGGRYTPLSLEDAVMWTKEIVKVFETAKVKILRLGLHPSEGLLSGENLVAGPFHVAFGEMVGSALWKEAFFNSPAFTQINEENDPERDEENQLSRPKNKMKLRVEIPVGQVNAAVGYTAENKKIFQQYFKKVVFCETPELSGMEFRLLQEDLFDS